MKHYELKNMSKKILLPSLAITALLLLGLTSGIQSILFAVAVMLCILIAFFDMRNATYLLFYFSPLSYILIYQQYNLYILPVVTYILMATLKRKTTMGVLLAPLLLVYCILFADRNISISIGQLIFPLLLLLIWFVCRIAEKDDYPKLVSYFSFGFVISACIGFFKDQIPLMQEIFALDELYIDGVVTTGEVIRYSGLSYDPNFFALIDCMLIAILLMKNGKMTVARALTLIFLVVVGFLTFSKSYVILLALIFIIFIFKNLLHPFRTLLVISAVLCGLALLDNLSGLKILALVNARFSSANNVNDLTTGRLDLWLKYTEYIFNNFRYLIFGGGFNTLSLGKAAHNTYIEYLYRFGLLGVALWIAYFLNCKKEIGRNKNKNLKKSFLAPVLVFFVGIFFLSAFYFQQFWCCIFFAMISPYLNGDEQNE